MHAITIHLDSIMSSLMVDLCLDPSDCRYIKRRLHSEGLAFATVTLPKLVKCVLLGIEIGSFYSAIRISNLTQFAWKGSSLRVFRSLLSRIFDAESKPIASDCAAKALAILRQLGEYLYKLCLEFTESQLTKGEAKYLEKETELAKADKSLDRVWVERLRKNFETYYSELSAANLYTVLANFKPRITSGAFSGSENFRDPVLFKQASDTPTVVRKFSALSGHFKPYPGSRAKVTFSSRDTGKHAVVKFVPKDSRGPRVISKEPFYHLMLQMAYFDFVSTTLSNITKGRVNFTDQSVNQRLSKESSVTGAMATLDLKDASDSVTLALTRAIFRNSPALRWFLRNSRTPTALMPSGKVLRLRKLAGMGSGLTFPTMALVIHLSVCTSVADALKLPYQEVSKSVYVYGDDLIIPTGWYDYALRGLAQSNLVVNHEKSYSRGLFRESCGADYYYGHDVTPVRARFSSGVKVVGVDRTLLVEGDRGVVQVERHCRELVKNGLFTLASYYYKRLEKRLGNLPSVYGESPALGRYDSFGSFKDTRCYVPKQIVRYSNLVCPYKHLGKVLTEYPTEVIDLLDIPPAARYGELVSPYDVKIVKRTVSHHMLYGMTPVIKA